MGRLDGNWEWSGTLRILEHRKLCNVASGNSGFGSGGFGEWIKGTPIGNVSTMYNGIRYMRICYSLSLTEQDFGEYRKFTRK